MSIKSNLVDAGIDYDGRQSMQVADHGYFNFVTVQPWALSDEKVRAVVVYKLWRQASGSRDYRNPPKPSNLDEVRALEQRATARLSKSPSWQRHLETANKFGGLLAYWTSLVYRRYRLKDGTFDLADRYGVDGNTIRQQLFHLNQIARQLFPAHVISVPQKGDCHRDPTSKRALRRAKRAQRIKAHEDRRHEREQQKEQAHQERAQAREAREQQVVALLEQRLSDKATSRMLGMDNRTVAAIRAKHPHLLSLPRSLGGRPIGWRKQHVN